MYWIFSFKFYREKQPETETIYPFNTLTWFRE